MKHLVVGHKPNLDRGTPLLGSPALMVKLIIAALIGLNVHAQLLCVQYTCTLDAMDSIAKSFLLNKILPSPGTMVNGGVWVVYGSKNAQNKKFCP